MQAGIGGEMDVGYQVGQMQSQRQEMPEER